MKLKPTVLFCFVLVFLEVPKKSWHISSKNDKEKQRTDRIYQSLKWIVEYHTDRK